MLYKISAFGNNPASNQLRCSICGTLRLHYIVWVFNEAYFGWRACSFAKRSDENKTSTTTRNQIATNFQIHSNLLIGVRVYSHRPRELPPVLPLEHLESNALIPIAPLELSPEMPLAMPFSKRQRFRSVWIGSNRIETVVLSLTNLTFSSSI